MKPAWFALMAAPICSRSRSASEEETCPGLMFATYSSMNETGTSGTNALRFVGNRGGLSHPIAG